MPPSNCPKAQPPELFTGIWEDDDRDDDKKFEYIIIDTSYIVILFVSYVYIYITCHHAYHLYGSFILCICNE